MGQMETSLGTVFDGAAASRLIRNQIRERIQLMQVKPSLAIILVGDREDSVMYVKMKEKACLDVGIKMRVFSYPTNVTLQELQHKGIRQLLSLKFIYSLSPMFVCT
jgi:5,10-methylene-tetrahydrofolate dehydrogenase/methenyl tetrahydrofolate cyclohydrolase